MSHSTVLVYLIVAIVSLMLPVIFRLATLARQWYLHNPRLDSYYKQLKESI